MSASLHPDQPLPELESSALLQPEATHFRSGPFQVGGTLRVDDATYIQRQADEDLFQCLRRGDLCYGFNSRQMGKSSLMVRVKYRLSQAGCRCMALDLTSIGTEDITAGQWYKGLCAQLWLGFELGAYSQFRAWWSSHQGEAYLLKLAICLRLVLQAYPLQPIVILVDEIDSVLALNFGVDDFFALIRYAYNQRAVEADFQRLTFALFGVATPSDLIRDRTRTPFNIGHALSLEGFSLAEAQPLAAVLGLPPDLAQAILAAILHWTAGQPFLTQKLCRLVWQQSQSPASLNLDSESALDWVSQLVRQRLIHHWATQDDPEHLRTIRDRLLRDPNQTGGILALYQRILAAEGEPAPAVLAASPDLADLLLSG
ncbi:MAG TPA: AAA-like domain-containing protein, partial [Leptolyngbyaceae cyanobacterium M65_K2018_010]|nr:AAA-like domain-containing protein [Leptolyngbyaceae cyanobacterium M65_K2018_010]